MASTPFLRTFSWRPETAEGCGENLAAMRGKQLTVSHFSMRVDDAVGLFWGQRVGWVLPLAHVASESEAVERAEWSVRRSEFRREARSKLGGFTLALPFVSDDRDDRHLGERHVRRACRLFQRKAFGKSQSAPCPAIYTLFSYRCQQGAAMQLAKKP